MDEENRRMSGAVRRPDDVHHLLRIGRVVRDVRFVTDVIRNLRAGLLSEQ